MLGLINFTTFIMYNKIDNTLALSLHVDKSLVSIMGKPDDNQDFIKETKDIINNIAGKVDATTVDYSYIQGLYRERALIHHEDGAIEVRYNKIFNNNSNEYHDPYRTFLIGQITCSNHNKLDYDRHTRACISVDESLRSSVYGSDFHIREIEIAGDTTDRSLGHQMFMSLVPWRANIQGYQFLTGQPPMKKYLRWGEHQYYHCKKFRGEKNRQWHCYPKPYDGQIIYRTEFKMYRDYLKPKGLRHHKDILINIDRWYSDNVKLFVPIWSKVPYRYRTKTYQEYPITRLIKQLRDYDGLSRYKIDTMMERIPMPPLNGCNWNS